MCPIVLLIVTVSRICLLRHIQQCHGSFCTYIVPRDIRSFTNPCYAFQILLTKSAVVAEHVMCRMLENG